MLDVSAWSGLTLVEQIRDGNRNEVWRAKRGRESLAVRRSRRSPESLAWELELLRFLADQGINVAEVVPADDGQPGVNGIVVQHWIEGREPTSAADWRAVADILQRLHSLTAGYAQRPECCSVIELETARRSVDADLDAVPEPDRSMLVDVFASFADVETAVVHGDPGPSNIRITGDGRVVFLDWDESRVDVAWHDLSNLGIEVLDSTDHERALDLSDAWEAANAWVAEPAYARTRLAALVERRSTY